MTAPSLCLPTCCCIATRPSHGVTSPSCSGPIRRRAQARSNLRNLFFALRQALPHADAYLSGDATTIQWRPNAPYTLDVADFRQALAEARRHAQSSDDAGAARWLETAVASYGGDLLPGCYDDWLIARARAAAPGVRRGIV